MDNNNNIFVGPPPMQGTIPPPQQPPQQSSGSNYKEPLVIRNGITRAFCYTTIVCIVITIINFVFKQLSGSTELGSVAGFTLALTIVGRINTISMLARIACIGFAVAATIIRVLNPHPYNTRSMIAGWIFGVASLLVIIFFH